MARYRTGRKVGNTLYVQQGHEPSDDDIFIGSCVSPGHAQAIADIANAAVDTAERLEALEEIRQRIADGWKPIPVPNDRPGDESVWRCPFGSPDVHMRPGLAAVLWPTTEEGPS